MSLDKPLHRSYRESQRLCLHNASSDKCNGSAHTVCAIKNANFITLPDDVWLKMPSDLVTQECERVKHQPDEIRDFVYFKLPIAVLTVLITTSIINAVFDYFHSPLLGAQIDWFALSLLMIGSMVLLWPWLHQARFLVLYTKPKDSSKLDDADHNSASAHFLPDRPDIKKTLRILVSLAAVYVVIVIAGYLILGVGIAGYWPTPARLTAPSTPEVWAYRVSFITVVLSYVLFFFMYSQALRRLNVKKICNRVEAAHLGKYFSRIIGILPTEARVGSTLPLLLDFDVSPEFENLCAGQHLEAEIQAAGMEIDGERRVQLCSSSPLPPAAWSCCLSSAGEQTINLRASVITPSRQNEAREVIFYHQHQIRVKSLVSASWLPVFTIALSAFSTLAALLQAYK